MPGTTRELTNTSDFPRATSLAGTEVLPGVEGNGSPVGVPVSLLQTTEQAAQESQSQAEKDAEQDLAIQALESAQTFNNVVAQTWAELSGLSGTADKQGAEVVSDSGSHGAASATGYDGSSVQNEGRYSWNASWSRWVRVGDSIGNQLGLKADQADLNETNAAVTEKVDRLAFESLDPNAPFVVLDQDGNLVFQGDASPQDTAVAEVTAARGEAASLSERLSRGLTSYGDPAGPVLNAHVLRNVRRQLRLIQQGQAAQSVMALFGDSWLGGEYIRGYFAKALHDVYGIAGLGWVGFQFFGTANTPPWVAGSNQPGGVKPGGGGGAILGCARYDLLPNPALNGSWTSVNAGASANATPSIGHISSSTAGDDVSFSWSGAAHDAADLYHPGLNAGSIRYSWDGGSTWETAVNLTATGPGKVVLANVPTGTSGSLVIEVVSGSVDLSGVDMKSSADGVRVHALSAPGSNTSHWAVDVAPADWAVTVVDDLGADFVAGLLATNDQSGSTSAQTVADNAEDILHAVAAQSSTVDLLWIAPAENIRGTAPAVTMAQYTAAVRKKAVDNGWAFVDLQAAFGDDPADYGYGSTLGLLDSSNLHPSRPAGGMAITDALLRLFAPTV